MIYNISILTSINFNGLARREIDVKVQKVTKEIEKIKMNL